MQTPEERKAELASSLNSLLTACQAHCPNSHAMAQAQLLSSSLGSARDRTPHEHARMMNLLASATEQVLSGAQTLDLDATPRQPTVDALRADLERSLPRGPNRG